MGAVADWGRIDPRSSGPPLGDDELHLWRIPMPSTTTLVVERTCRFTADELVRLLRDLGEVARGRFPVVEPAALEQVPAAEALSAFLDCWTRKEAWLKATGSGLSVPLESSDVTLARGGPDARITSPHRAASCSACPARCASIWG
jgi:hypothetical protein